MNGGRAKSEKLVRDEELMRYLIGGYKIKEICAIHDLNYQSVLRACRRPEFLEKLKGLSELVFENVDMEIKASKTMIKDRVEDLASCALDRLADLIMSDDERVAMTATSRALDMNTQTAKVTKSETESKHSFVNPLQLMNAVKAAEEMDRKLIEGSTVPTTTEGETIQ